ncbi:MAG: ABC transporter permease [Muribaculaceae bacterium]|nr:ABC transporter permease [Muribaculaceae bacterium]
MLDLINEILQTLRHNKLRTALTGIAVAWGIFMLIVLLGVSRGLYNSMQRNSSIEANSSMSVWNGWTSMPFKGYKEGRWIRMVESDMDEITRHPGDHIESAMGAVSISDSKIKSMRDYISGEISGVYPGAEVSERLKITHGRFITQRDMDERRKVMVLRDESARLLFGTEEKAVGSRVDCMGLSWMVVGVYEDKWQRTTYVPFTTAMMLNGNDGRLYNITVKLHDMKDAEDAAAAERRVREALATAHEFDPDDMGAIHVWNRFENYIQQQTVSTILNTVVWVIGLLTMLSGIVGVSNIMFVSVRERTHEIGVRRAIGAKPRSILVQVLAESVAITALFGYAGVFLGILVTEVIDRLFGTTDVLYNPRVDISIAVQVTVVLVIVGALAGLFPAIKATKVKPVEALRDE